MAISLLFTNKDDINNLDTSNPLIESTEQNEDKQAVNTWHELILTGNTSFLTIIKRLCKYWRRILFNKIRLILTLIFMSMLNISARITCFTRQRAPPPPSSFIPSTIRTPEEDLNDSSKTHLLLDKTNTQQIDLPSLQNSKMAHMLLRQTNRTQNISIHRSTTSSSSQKDTSLPMAHSVDDRLFLYKHDPTKLMNLLTRFASEPQMSKYHTQTNNLNGHFNDNYPVVFALTSPSLQLDQPEEEEVEIHFDDFPNLYCDKVQPVSTSFIEDFNSDKLDNIATISSEHILREVKHSNDELQTPPLNEDILFDTSPSIINGNDPTQAERQFRRRKRRSSLTRNSLTLDDTTQLPQDLINKIDINKEMDEDLELSLSVKQNGERENVDIIQTKTPENEETKEAIIDHENPASVSRYRGRRLRHRFYHHSASSSSSPEEVTSDSPVDFDLPNEALNIETTRIHSPTPTSPVSPIPSLFSNPQSTNSSPISGGLKRIHSVGGTKKNVRFADSIGRELTQVQYIRSSNNDESKELSFLIGSSLLSSSPPSFTKHNLYVPSTSGLDHKPWSFDVASTANKLTTNTCLPRRFFCLYRQPNSEHPDIYLHEVWKSQIKLEHADIPIKYYSTGDRQQLTGTLWVTNGSYCKHVSIKYSFNHWLNTCEHEAQHRGHSNDFRNLDKFDFSIDIPADVDRVDFILRYCVNGQEYWDNNEGKNYTLQTESAYTPQTTISLPHDCDLNEMRFY